MKILHSTVLTASLLAVVPATAATIVTSDISPSANDFASDAVHTLGTSLTQLRIRDGFDAAGQSFTLGTTGDPDYQLNSITFLSSGTGGSATESSVGLTIRLYEGTPEDDGTPLSSTGLAFISGGVREITPFYEFTFGPGSGTFDTTEDSFITFQFDAAEIATIGNLTAGTEYSFSIGVDTAVETTDIDFRIRRDNTNGYANGTSFIPSRVLDGADAGETQNGDAAFVINATAVPEPSSTFLTGLAGLALLARRRRS